jgi:hypothetical protein
MAHFLLESNRKINLDGCQRTNAQLGRNATQNNGNHELSIVILGGAQRMIVVDSGKNRNDCKTKDNILKLVLGCLRKHPQHDVGSFERL